MSSHYCVVQHHLPCGILVPRAMFQQDNCWIASSLLSEPALAAALHLVLVSLGWVMLNWCLERRHRNSKHLQDQVTLLAEFGATGHFALCSATVCRGRGAVAGAPSSQVPACRLMISHV